MAANDRVDPHANDVFVRSAASDTVQGIRWVAGAVPSETFIRVATETINPATKR
jgi:hypothetical protein